MRYLLSFLIAAGLFGQTTVVNGPGGGASNPVSNGLQIWNTSAWSTAAFSDIVAKFGSGSCSGYLYSDGTCSTPSGYSVPSLASFTWVNQTSGGTTATAAQTVSGGPIAMKIPDTSAVNWRGLFVSMPATPFKLIVQVKVGYQPYTLGNSQDFGMYWYDGTKLLGFECLTQSNGFTPRVEHITNVTTDGSTVSTGWSINTPFSQGLSYGPGEWIQLRDDGTTLYWDYSLDGINFTNMYSEAVGTFITPTKIGFGGISVVNNASYYVLAYILNWRVVNNANLNG